MVPIFLSWLQLDDLKIKLHSWFSCNEVQACKRDANKVANQIATIGKSCNANEAFIWDAHVPAHVAKLWWAIFPMFCNEA